MKRVLLGSFQCESNTFNPQTAKAADFEIFTGRESLRKFACLEIFRQAGVEPVPLPYISTLPAGEVEPEAFWRFTRRFLREIGAQLPAGGIYLYLHGSMYVRGQGSGEELFLAAVRELVGEGIPIVTALDFHANLSPRFAGLVNGVQGFRTAPHQDQDDTEIRAARSLLRCMELETLPHPARIRLPFLCGDAMTTDRGPFPAVTGLLEEMDRDKAVISCALFGAQPWYDSPHTGACAVVSALDGGARQRAEALAKRLWDGREQLQLEDAVTADQAVEEVQAHSGPPLFVNDSGDNTTAGAPGTGTLLLRGLLEAGAENVLVCGIQAPEAALRLLEQPQGTVHDIVLCRGGKGPQEIETPLTVTVRGKGRVCGWAGDEVGRGVLARCGGIDLVLTEARAAFTTPEHFRRMGVNPADYRAVVLKMGYLFPRLRELSEKTLFVLTPGISTNDFASLDFRRLQGKIYPVHRDISWADILEQARREQP